MSKVIYKYEVPVGDVHDIDLPRPAEILHVGRQGAIDVVCFWAVVDPAVLDTRRRRFQVVGTGHIWPVGAWYIGTAQAQPFVWHLLELGL